MPKLVRPVKTVIGDYGFKLEVKTVVTNYGFKHEFWPFFQTCTRLVFFLF